MKIQIPPSDVSPIRYDDQSKQFLWTDDWYDVLKSLERIGLLDLFDVAPTAPANNQVMIWNSTTGKFTPGAN